MVWKGGDVVLERELAEVDMVLRRGDQVNELPELCLERCLRAPFASAPQRKHLRRGLTSWKSSRRYT